MATVNDPIASASPSPSGIEMPPLHEPQTIEATPSYVSSSGVTVMTAEELAGPQFEAAPMAPGFNKFGNRYTHMTGRFLLATSERAYRIFKFQSADPPTEFPLTGEGWTLAWSTFRKLEGQAA